MNSHNNRMKHETDMLRVMNDYYMPDYLPLRPSYENGQFIFNFSQNLPKIELVNINNNKNEQ